MPTYSLRIRSGSGLSASREIGFYHDGGAVAYARRTAGSAIVEVWRENDLIATVGEGPVKGGSVHRSLSAER